MLKRRIEKVFVGLYFRYLNEGKKYLKIKGMIDIIYNYTCTVYVDEE